MTVIATTKIGKEENAKLYQKKTFYGKDKQTRKRLYRTTHRGEKEGRVLEDYKPAEHVGGPRPLFMNLGEGFHRPPPRARGSSSITLSSFTSPR